MKKRYKQYYESAKPIATQCVTNNCSIDIMDINYGVDEFVVVRGYIGDIHKYKLNITKNGRMFFTYQNGLRYYVDEFMAVRYEDI